MTFDHVAASSTSPSARRHYDFYGANRAQQRPVRHVLVALDARTSESRWRFQFVTP